MVTEIRITSVEERRGSDQKAAPAGFLGPWSCSALLLDAEAVVTWLGSLCNNSLSYTFVT